MLLGMRFVLIVPLWYKFKLTSPRDADTANTLCLKVCYVPAVCEAPYRFAIGASALYCGNKNRSTRKE